MSDFFEFEDKARVERLVGTLHDPAATPGDVLTVQADGSVSAAPGAGSTPVQAVYFGDPLTIANNASGALTWDTLGSGTALLDITAPAAPTFLADGFYLILATVTVDTALTAAGYSPFSIAGDVANAAGVLGAGAQVDGVTVTQAQQYSTGDSPSINVTNSDGVASHDFTLATAVVIKLA